MLRARQGRIEDWMRGESQNQLLVYGEGVERSKGLIAKGSMLEGTSIDVWNDPWLLWLEGFKSKIRQREEQNMEKNLNSKIHERLKMMLWRIATGTFTMNLLPP